MPFGGETYDRDRDRDRLLAQLLRVRAHMMGTAKRTHAIITIRPSGRSNTVLLLTEALEGHGYPCIMSKWQYLKTIEAATTDPQASISARLRDHRKLKFGGLHKKNPEPQFGGWVMERDYVGPGLWRYRLTWFIATKRRRLVRVGRRSRG